MLIGSGDTRSTRSTSRRRLIDSPIDATCELKAGSRSFRVVRARLSGHQRCVDAEWTPLGSSTRGSQRSVAARQDFGEERSIVGQVGLQLLGQAVFLVDIIQRANR